MSTRNDLANEIMGKGGFPATSSGMGGEVLAQAIEDLTVKDEDKADRPNQEAVVKMGEEESSTRAFSPSALNSSLPPINTGYHTSNFNTRTTSPIMAESVSPTFGMGPHATNSSPSTSQVSVGSVGPTLVASLLNQRHHYDLTPVMRNTKSGGGRPMGSGMGHNTGTDDNGVVSPDTEEEESADFLHGEHLSLPADLSTAEDGGVILPNLRKSTIPSLPMQRAKSLGTAKHMSFMELPGKPAPGIPPRPGPSAELPPPAPVEFPARKFYSFTSREQYKGIAVADDEDLSEEESLEERPDLTPYQPTRQEFAEIEESMPPEALHSIFIERRRRRSVRENHIAEEQEEIVDEESSHKNHRLLQNPIPMTDRQWSIPSLHMGQRLATDGSLASLTDHLDDESLLYGLPSGGNGDMTDEDEASLSSRASSLYMSIGGPGLLSTVPTGITDGLLEEPDNIPEPSTIWNDNNSSSVSQYRSTGSASFDGVPSFGSSGPPPESIHNSKVVVESPWNLLSGTQSSMSDENSAVAVDGDRAVRRKRKQRQREEAALSWLRSLQQQSTEPPVAEAASSKFLTGRTQANAFCKTTSSSDDATALAAVMTEGHRQS